MYYDEESDLDEPLTTNDTANRTKIHHEEGRPKSDDADPVGAATGIPYWERLSGINSGVVDSFGNRDHAKARYQERLAAWDVMSEHLRLSPSQKRNGRGLMGEFDTENFGESLFLAAFCLAAHVVKTDPYIEADNSCGRVYHPRRADDNNCPIFLEIADEFDFDNSSHLHGCFNRLEACLP